MNLRNLTLLSVFLFLIAVSVYWNENRRGMDLVAGSEFVKGLDLSKVAKIELGFSEGKKIQLKKDSNQYILENYKSFPADAKKINDLIYKIASIEVAEKITETTSEEKLSGFELGKEMPKYSVKILDASGRSLASFRVGRSLHGKGNYLLKEGSNTVYLSKNSLWINNSYKDFINDILIDIEKNKIKRVDIAGKKTLLKKDKKWLIEKSKKELEKEKVEKLEKLVSRLRFKEVFAPTEPSVQSVQFEKDLKLELENELKYSLSIGKKDKKTFLKVYASAESLPEKIQIKQDAQDADFMKVSDIIGVKTQAEDFNRRRASWIYEVDEEVEEIFSL